MEAYCLPGQTGHFDQIQISFSSYPEQKESCKFVVIPETCDLILDQQIEEETWPEQLNNKEKKDNKRNGTWEK